jgi:hypothetical protein
LPYSVHRLTGSRDGSDNITLTWNRRSRFEPLVRFGEPPLGEASESYDVEFWTAAAPGGTLLRTKTVGGSTANYAAAEQTADGHTPGDPVYYRVFQLSAVVGSGTEASITV